MSDRFSQKWLETLCSLLPDVHSAVFMVPAAEKDGLQLLARWPNDLEQPRDFFDSVKYALKKGGDVCLARARTVDGEALDFFAKPIYIRSDLAGVLSIKMKHLPRTEHVVDKVVCLPIYNDMTTAECDLFVQAVSLAGPPVCGNPFVVEVGQ